MASCWPGWGETELFSNPPQITVQMLAQLMEKNCSCRRRSSLPWKGSLFSSELHGWREKTFCLGLQTTALSESTSDSNGNIRYLHPPSIPFEGLSYKGNWRRAKRMMVGHDSQIAWKLLRKRVSSVSLRRTVSTYLQFRMSTFTFKVWDMQGESNLSLHPWRGITGQGASYTMTAKSQKRGRSQTLSWEKSTWLQEPS